MTSTPSQAPDPSTGSPDPRGPAGPRVGPEGRYVLGALLGHGGMADVYRAVDRTLGRDVAIKLLRDRTPDAVDRARFVTEARTLARLNHPHLVTILDAGISEEHPFLVLELVDGPSLSVELRERGPLGPDRVSRIGAQIADALAHCHAAGIVHRDVKPGNILLGPGDRALLTDFGIARMIDAAAHHTQTGFTIGTASYLAPEQVTGDHVTPAVDAYALGLVLLEASTGHREYSGPPVEAALARLHRSPRVPRELPAPLRDVLTELTRTDPALRPTARETARGLDTPISSTVDPSPVLATPPAAQHDPLATEPTQVPRSAAQAAPTNGAPTSRPSPTRFGDVAAALHAGDTGAIGSSSTRPSRRSAVPLLGWAAAAAAGVALVLVTLPGHTATPTAPPTDDHQEPAAATPSPSARPTAPERLSTSVATTRTTSASTPSRARAATTPDTPRTPARTAATTPRAHGKAPARPVKAKKVRPVKAPKGQGKHHGKSDHKGR